MTQPAKSQEPSMEEILASIRRIIADDDATKSAQPRPEAPPAAPATRSAAPAQSTGSAPRVAPPEPNLPEFEAQSTLPAVDTGSDILDLTESMASPAPATTISGSMPQFRTIDGSSDVSFDDAIEKIGLQSNADHTRRPLADDRDEHRGDARAQLISSVTSAAVDSAFNSLAHTVLVQNARTLEDLVREMLRPMLKSWLDDNLPGVVERLVRTEIERVARGRMG
jgi:hypothetical protein